MSIAYPTSQERIQNKINMFEDIANDLGIHMDVLDSEATTLKFTNGKVHRLVYGFSFGINGSGETRVCIDKSATASILEKEKIPHVPHSKISRGKTKEISWPRIKAFAAEQKQPFNIVAKPLYGKAGIGVTHARGEKELETMTDGLFRKMKEISLSPFYSIEDEYRVIVLNHGIEYVMRKEKRYVVGDGISTVGHLISLSRHKSHTLSDVVLNQIPALNQKVYITWKHNGFTVHRIPIDSKDPLQIKIRELASRATKALAMAFCCVDIIKIEADDQPIVLEVNSDVWVESHEVGYDDAKRTYTKVVAQLVGKQGGCCTYVQRLFQKYVPLAFS